MLPPVAEGVASQAMLLLKAKDIASPGMLPLETNKAISSAKPQQHFPARWPLSIINKLLSEYQMTVYSAVVPPGAEETAFLAMLNQEAIIVASHTHF